MNIIKIFLFCIIFSFSGLYAEKPVKFAVLTDLHGSQLTLSILDYYYKKVDGILIGGDVEKWEDIRSFILEHPFYPIYILPGDHDLVPVNNDKLIHEIVYSDETDPEKILKKLEDKIPFLLPLFENTNNRKVFIEHIKYINEYKDYYRYSQKRKRIFLSMFSALFALNDFINNITGGNLDDRVIVDKIVYNLAYSTELEVLDRSKNIVLKRFNFAKHPILKQIADQHCVNIKKDGEIFTFDGKALKVAGFIPFADKFPRFRREAIGRFNRVFKNLKHLNKSNIIILSHARKSDAIDILHYNRFENLSEPVIIFGHSHIQKTRLPQNGDFLEGIIASTSYYTNNLGKISTVIVTENEGRFVLSTDLVDARKFFYKKYFSGYQVPTALINETLESKEMKLSFFSEWINKVYLNQDELFSQLNKDKGALQNRNLKIVSIYNKKTFQLDNIPRNGLVDFFAFNLVIKPQDIFFKIVTDNIEQEKLDKIYEELSSKRDFFISSTINRGDLLVINILSLYTEVFNEISLKDYLFTLNGLNIIPVFLTNNGRKFTFRNGYKWKKIKEFKYLSVGKNHFKSVVDNAQKLIDYSKQGFNSRMIFRKQAFFIPGYSRCLESIFNSVYSILPYL